MDDSLRLACPAQRFGYTLWADEKKSFNALCAFVLLTQE
jgi:hypothetical protein